MQAVTTKLSVRSHQASRCPLSVCRLVFKIFAQCYCALEEICPPGSAAVLLCSIPQQGEWVVTGALKNQMHLVAHVGAHPVFAGPTI